MIKLTKHLRDKLIFLWTFKNEYLYAITLSTQLEIDQSSQQKFGFNSSSQFLHKHLVGHNKEKTALKFDCTNSVKMRSEDKDEQDSEDEIENSCVEGKVEDVNIKVVRESHIEKDPKFNTGLIKSVVGTFGMCLL